MATTLDYSAIESAMNTVLSADATLDAVITTFQAGHSTDVAEDRINMLGFAAAELPACMAFVRTFIGDQVRTDPDSYGETLEHIPCGIFVVDRKSTHAAALASVVAATEMVERIVKKQVKTVLNWGGSGHTEIETVRSGLSAVPDGRQFVVIGEVLFDMMTFTQVE